MNSSPFLITFCWELHDSRQSANSELKVGIRSDFLPIKAAWLQVLYGAIEAHTSFRIVFSDNTFSRRFCLGMNILERPVGPILLRFLGYRGMTNHNTFQKEALTHIAANFQGNVCHWQSPPHARIRFSSYCMSLEIKHPKKTGESISESLLSKLKRHTIKSKKTLQPANLGKVGGPAAPVSNTNIPHAISRLQSFCKYAGFSSASLRTYLSKTSLRHHRRLQHALQSCAHPRGRHRGREI